MKQKIDFKALEKKWRPYWAAIDLYETGEDSQKPKAYVLDYFPYPSGHGLSVGHCRNYVPTCIYTRYLRMKGVNVLHPMGWDAFGLPAENYAIKHGVHPRVTTNRQAANYKRQMQLVECCYDWSREINSSDPDFYRWTQWFFLLLYHRGLAYRAISNQWWCPVDKTILANEQVENGRCWRCNSLVTKKALPQWFFKITDYADRLLADLDGVDWPEPIKQMQRNWIGRSPGAEISFPVPGQEETIKVFTTRPDTLFGVTFITLAPEHPLVVKITTPAQQPAVEAYVAQAIRQSEIDRLATDREKTGVFSGAYARHPITGNAMPIWVADYVMMDVGTGAVMGVPGHDMRDYAFARQMVLPVVTVIAPENGEPAGECTTEPGILVNSGRYEGQNSAAGGAQIVADLAAEGMARATVSYRLRDWLISRQRYWGAPIPIVHCAACGIVPVPEDELPVLLPEIDTSSAAAVEAFAPAGDGRSPLARAEEWVQTTCPQCSGPAQRETDTMDGFACSSWYFLRFADPHYEDGPFNPQKAAYWLPVDTYVGGAEHAVMHLLYARFWTKVMFDAGMLSFTEPFTQLRNQGVLHAADGRRMSKSKGNVVTPDEVIAQHGTDALRTYIVFLGPFDANVNWTETGIKGVNRFLNRFQQWAQTVGTGGEQEIETGRWWNPANETHAGFRRQKHRTIERMTADFSAFKFNTAVAALMEWLNYLESVAVADVPPARWRDAVEIFCLLLAPIAPFITEEVWQEVLGHPTSVHRQSWPAWDPAALETKQITVAVQVNGKLRDTITVRAGSDQDAVYAQAMTSANVQRHIDGRPVQRTIYVPGRLINIVIND